MYVRYFTNIDSFHSWNIPMRRSQVCLWFPFLRWGEWGMQRWRDLPKIMGIRKRQSWHLTPDWCCFPYNTLLQSMHPNRISTEKVQVVPFFHSCLFKKPNLEKLDLPLRMQSRVPSQWESHPTPMGDEAETQRTEHPLEDAGTEGQNASLWPRYLFSTNFLLLRVWYEDQQQ